MAFLVDDRAGEAYEIGRGPLGIGRDPVSHVIVLDPAVSRFHAEVRSTTTGFTLISMGATGTMLNGKPVTSPRLLTEGDAIGIGDHTFRFTRQRPTADDIVVVEPPDVDEDHVPSAAASDAVTRLPTMVNRTIEPDADAPLIGTGGSGRSPLLLVAAATTVATIIAILIVIWRLRHR
jgi:pSer/pThr/pTyr-binding forkhead associated (FHA) protein